MAKSECNHGSRYTIVGDESGHEYFVPVGDEEQFYRWVDYHESEDPGAKYVGPDYNDCRIDGSFSFLDPRCE